MIVLLFKVDFRNYYRTVISYGSETNPSLRVSIKSILQPITVCASWLGAAVCAPVMLYITDFESSGVLPWAERSILGIEALKPKKKSFETTAWL